ncbi:MAG: right-handed parallel beta-helix repeat-containing protein [Thermoguttaceae bacterium]|jgi:hypothetical protein
MRYVLIALAIFFSMPIWITAGEPPAATQFFVSPAGNDANPGTQEKPFASLERTRDAVRWVVASGLRGDVKVLIRQGVYELSEPLVFGPEDSGSQQFVITYAAQPGENVILSGGKRLSGWKRSEGEVWTVAVPGVAEGRWYFRNLYVNGKRAVRARSPNQDAQPNCLQLKGAELTKDLTRFTLTVAPGVLRDWSSTADIEVMVAGNWEINRKRVESLDAKANRIVLAPPHQSGPDYIFPNAGRWYHLENARELLDQPGEWYLDRKTGTLSYWPRPGEDMTRCEVVAPVLQQLLVLQGPPQKAVRNLHFKGLRFEYTDWELPKEGYMGVQASHYGNAEHHVPSAIRLAWAENCSIEDGVLARLGGCGVEVATGCRENLIQGNRVFDVSANGILVYGPNSEAEVPKGNRVSNNHVHACGREFYGAVGIWVGFAQGTVVAHNLVHDLPYTGISAGWQWNPQPTACKENRIEYNHVYDVMNRLCDGGCIYTLGFQPGTVIRGNHLHDVHRSFLAQGAPNNGMFIDEGSKGFLFEQNVIYKTAAELLRFNACNRDWHTWRDNYFGEPEITKAGAKEIMAQAGLEPPYGERLMDKAER